jgi:hypothetical protein
VKRRSRRLIIERDTGGSDHPTTARKKTLVRKLGESFERIAEGSKRVNKQRRRDFVFHMTDWEEDLFRLAQFYASPARYTARETDRLLSGFLYHAPNHLAQAARLGEFFSDVFADKPIITASGRPLAPYAPPKK